MIRFGIVLSVVLIAIGLLAAGAVAGSLLLVMVSIAVAALAALMLVLVVVIGRREIFGARPDAVQSAMTEAALPAEELALAAEVDSAFAARQAPAEVLARSSAARDRYGRPAGVRERHTRERMTRERVRSDRDDSADVVVLPASAISASEAGDRDARRDRVAAAGRRMSRGADRPDEAAAEEARAKEPGPKRPVGTPAPAGRAAAEQEARTDNGDLIGRGRPGHERSDRAPSPVQPAQAVAGRTRLPDASSAMPARAAQDVRAHPASGTSRPEVRPEGPAPVAQVTETAKPGRPESRPAAARPEPESRPARPEPEPAASPPISETDSAMPERKTDSVRQTSLISVRVVPGIARYHSPDCILIRFLAPDDLEIMTIDAAADDGYVACKACKPDQAEAAVTSG